jgi:4-carboxymuconolactone decarboxylase
MQSHMKIALNIGITESQLKHMLSIIETNVGKEEADAGRKILTVVTGTGNLQPNKITSDSINILYAKGVRAPAGNFTGVVWINTLVGANDDLDVSMGVVTFEAGARSNWHMHPGGQVLLVTDGTGYFQERDKPIEIMRKGDVIKCKAGVEHWHGASYNKRVSHIAIATNSEKGAVVWLQKVTDEEYKIK